MNPCRTGSVAMVTGLAALALLVAQGAADAQSGGAILVNARASGQEATASVVVATAEAEPREVAKGQSGRPIPVPAGRYDVTVTCTDLLDHPTQQLRDVNVAGETITREVSFPAGTITLHVKLGGRDLKNKELVLRRGGEELPGRAQTGQAFKISPGTYEASITTGKNKSNTITGIQAYDGATRHIPASL